MLRSKAFQTIVLVLAGGCLTLVQAQSCSNETVRGYYGYWGQWTIYMQPPGTQPGQAPLTPVPSSSVCTVTIDYQGRVSAACTSSLGGQIAQSTLTGSVAVNSNCTATFKWASSIAPNPAVMNWVILDNGDLIVEHPLVGAFGNPVGFATYQRISRVPPN